MRSRNQVTNTRQQWGSNDDNDDDDELRMLMTISDYLLAVWAGAAKFGEPFLSQPAPQPTHIKEEEADDDLNADADYDYHSILVIILQDEYKYFLTSYFWKGICRPTQVVRLPRNLFWSRIIFS